MTQVSIVKPWVSCYTLNKSCDFADLQGAIPEFTGHALGLEQYEVLTKDETKVNQTLHMLLHS